MQTTTRILPRRAVFGSNGRYGRSISSGKRDIHRGVFVPSIPMGPRQVGWIEAEVEAVLRARIAGKSEDEIRELVRQLVAARAAT
jgi:prophage regulatory protein